MWLTKSVINGSASTRLEVEVNVEYGTVSILAVIQVCGLKQLCKQFFNLLPYFVFDLFDNESFAPDGSSILAIWTPVVGCPLYIPVSFTVFLRCRESFCGTSLPSSEKHLSSQVPAVGLFGFFGGFVLLLFWFFSPLFIKIGHYWANTDFSLDIGKHRDDLWRLTRKLLFFSYFFLYWAFKIYLSSFLLAH